MTRASLLLKVLQSYSTASEEQISLLKWYSDLREKVVKDVLVEHVEREVEKVLINELANGINYGNWLWTKVNVNEN